MSIFKILHSAVRLMSMRGFTRFTGTAGYIHVSAGKGTSHEAFDKEKAPDADDCGKGQNDVEAILHDKFSQLTSDDQSAIIRFIEYASNPDAQHKGIGADDAVEDWLDEQARMYTQSDANPL